MRSATIGSVCLGLQSWVCQFNARRGENIMAMHGAKCRAVQQCIGILGGMPSEFDCFMRSWWSFRDCPRWIQAFSWKAGAYSDCPVEVEQEASLPAGAYYDVLHRVVEVKVSI